MTSVRRPGSQLPEQSLVTDIRRQLHHWKHRRRYRRLRQAGIEYSLAGFDELRCIFVHIPKSAGVSVNRALFGNLGGGHRTVDDYLRIFGPITYHRYFTFTFVRHPLDRLLSAYSFLARGGFDDEDRAWAARHLSRYSSFDDFVLHWLTEENIWTKRHFVPQHHFFCDRGEVPRVDFIGRFENLEADFRYVCRELGVTRTLDHHNRTAGRPAYEIDLGNEVRQRVSSIYRTDFEILGYE